MYQDIPAVTRQKVKDMYAAGERLKNIQDETSLSRPTIYWILRTEGMLPDRKPRLDTLSVQDLLEALRASEQEVGRLRGELERLQTDS